MKASFQKNKNTKSGFGIIEVLVSSAIAAVLLVAFLTIIVEAQKIARLNVDNLQAEFYLVEVTEAARDLERSDWSSLSAVSASCSATPCGLSITGGTWVIDTTGSETLDGGYYIRKLYVEDVCRDASYPTFPNTIANCDGTNPNDPDTKKVRGSISWLVGSDIHTKDIETYVYNYGI